MSLINDTMDRDGRLFSVVRRLFAETGRQHLGQYAVAFVLSAIVAGTTAAVAFLLKDVINEIFVEKSVSALFSVSLAVLIIFVARGFAMFGQAVILSKISNAIVLELQVRLFGRVMSKEPSFIFRSSSAELMMIVNHGAASASSLLNALMLAVGRDIFTIIGLLAVLFVQNYILALVMIGSIPIIAIVVSAITKRVRSISREQLEVGAMLSNRIRASIQGIKVVKAFGIENDVLKKMNDNASRLKKLGVKQAIVSNRLAPFMESVGGAIAAGAIAIGGWRVINHGDTPGELVSFMFAALMIYDPARRLSQARAGIESSLVGIRLMYDFLDREDLEAESPAAKPLKVGAGCVRFQNVDFGYAPDQLVLKQLSLEIEGGKTTAVVGRSGGGKTTIANLLLRFWRPSSGHIEIDGQNINDVTVSSLRSSIAYVGQDAFLFDGTIRENLLVGKRDASEAEIVAALEAADAYDFVKQAANGLDTSVGELGVGLSGGQRQRIAIARALLRDTPIVLLDEPTSALDGETERGIQNALNRLAEGRTTIIIAHRLSTIRHADKILVVSNGKVIETGTHAALIRADGQYARLYAEMEPDAEPPMLGTSF